MDTMQPQQSQIEPDKLLPVLVLLFDSLPQINSAILSHEIAMVTPGLTASDVTVDLTVNEVMGTFGTVQFAEHKIKLIGIAAPHPDFDTYLQPAHLRPDQKQVLGGHKAHIICYYESEHVSAVEYFIALYKVAYGLRNHALLGVMNPITWMCIAAEMLPSTLENQFLQAFRQSPASALMLWLGFIKFFKPDKTVWFATKGNFLFGLPDFAYLGSSLNQTQEAINLFGNIITYLYTSGAKLAPGHTMQVGQDTYLRFSLVTEYADYLGHQTLVMEKIRAKDTNKRKWF